ncbi:MAG: HAMP domain-containing histidine kinase [Euzebyaceae bacterium]|nr:HAMP domain-containing histidine kinase [Euzebyaceae bacterium]
MTQPVEHVLQALPRGNSLDDRSFQRRHHLLLGLLLAHVPALLVAGWLTGHSPGHLLFDVVPLLGLVCAGLWLPHRGLQIGAVTLGLLLSAAALVHLTGGATEAHFHYFVVLGLIGLYQDWRPYLLAVGYVVIGNGLLGTWYPGGVYSDPRAAANPWGWAMIHGAFLLAASIGQLVLWRIVERQQGEARHHYTALFEGEHALVDQMRQAQQLKDELIAIVGHEFRTPLTSIVGYARTLTARVDDMDRRAVKASATAITREAKRLTRLVANLLAASEDARGDVDQVSDLAGISGAVIDDLDELAPALARRVNVSVPAGHHVAMAPESVHQVVFNLLDNAVKFADHETEVGVTSRRDDQMVVLEVTNVGPEIDEADRGRIFEAFVQADSSDTRRYGGLGLGLHIVRKVVEAHGGRVGLFGEGPLVIFRTWLPAAQVSPQLVAAPASSR